MSTITIHKAENESMDVVLDNVPTKFYVGRSSPKQFKRFSLGDVLIIPAFDDEKIFRGWAELKPIPTTIQDIAGLGYDIFESALSSAVIKIQQSIRSKANGKQVVDKALLELTKAFALGTITAEELKERVLALQGNKVVQV